MQILVNGKPETLPESLTVRALLEHLGLAEQPAAVEINKSLVPKRAHAERRLAEGDRVEVVTLVGGG